MLLGLPAKEPKLKQVQVAPMLVDLERIGAEQNRVSTEARGPTGQNVIEFEVAWLNVAPAAPQKGASLERGQVVPRTILCNALGSSAGLGSGNIHIVGATSCTSCLCQHWVDWFQSHSADALLGCQLSIKGYDSQQCPQQLTMNGDGEAFT